MKLLRIKVQEFLRILSLFLCVLSLSCAAQYQPETLAWGDFGNTTIYNGGTKGVELLLTDNQHQPQAKLFAEQLSQQGNLSAVLNMDSYSPYLSCCDSNNNHIQMQQIGL